MRTLAAGLLALAACTAADGRDGSTGGGVASEETGAPTAAPMPPDRYVYVALRDTRDCDPPACGGWFVQRVDRAEPQYVAVIDLSTTGLSPEAQDEILAVAASNPDVTRASIAFRGMTVESAYGWEYPELRVAAVWRGPTPEADYHHTGVWYSFADDYPETVGREIGGSREYALRVYPTTPDGVRDSDTLAVGWRDEDSFTADYRLIRVRP